MIYIADWKMRAFISGPVTGTDDYIERFAEAEEELTKRGYIAVNPVKVLAAVPFPLSWDKCMDITLALLRECDAFYSLEGSKWSAGARIESEYAKKLGLVKVMHHEAEERTSC